MISCSEAVRQLWQYLEGEVAAGKRAEVEEHLAFCRRCCGEAEFAAELRAFLAKSAAERMPPEVRQRLTATLEALEPR